MTNINQNNIYIDPFSKAYYEDRLFDQANRALNRDDSLAPFIRLRDVLAQRGSNVHTADFLPQKENLQETSDYYSFGMLENFEHLSARDDVRLRAFLIFEPPVVDPRLYKVLPELTAAFERVYVHNVDGDGYSLKGVNKSRLRKLYWPQTRNDVLTDFWTRENRLRRIVMINGNHKPASYDQELYSRRIDALAALSKFGAVVMYGRGGRNGGRVALCGCRTGVIAER